MAPILFFLGSGASAPFELPTMKDLVPRFEESLRQFRPPVQSEIDLYCSIRNTLFKEYDYSDLESVFSVLEDLSNNIEYRSLGFTPMYELAKLHKKGNQTITDETTQNYSKSLLGKFVQFIKNEYEVDRRSQDDEIKRIFFDLYDTVGRSLKSWTESKTDKKTLHHEFWPIYTTNYDLVQERFWEDITDINDLSKRNERGLEVIDVTQTFARGPRVKLVKLHGSLNWYKIEGREIVKSEKDRVQFGGKVVKGRMMLYPIQQKDLYLEPWFTLLNGFKKDLEETKIWIIIGYSFHDLFIKEIFLESLKNGKKMVIVDPNAKIIKKEGFDFDDVLTIPAQFHKADTLTLIGKEIADLISDN